MHWAGLLHWTGLDWDGMDRMDLFLQCDILVLDNLRPALKVERRGGRGTQDLPDRKVWHQTLNV